MLSLLDQKGEPKETFFKIEKNTAVRAPKSIKKTSLDEEL
jgi:hypothetical protein